MGPRLEHRPPGAEPHPSPMPDAVDLANKVLARGRITPRLHGEGHKRLPPGHTEGPERGGVAAQETHTRRCSVLTVPSIPSGPEARPPPYSWHVCPSKKSTAAQILATGSPPTPGSPPGCSPCIPNTSAACLLDHTHFSMFAVTDYPHNSPQGFLTSGQAHLIPLLQALPLPPRAVGMKPRLTTMTPQAVHVLPHLAPRSSPPASLCPPSLCSSPNLRRSLLTRAWVLAGPLAGTTLFL